MQERGRGHGPWRDGPDSAPVLRRPPRGEPSVPDGSGVFDDRWRRGPSGTAGGEVTLQVRSGSPRSRPGASTATRSGGLLTTALGYVPEPLNVDFSGLRPGSSGGLARDHGEESEPSLQNENPWGSINNVCRRSEPVTPSDQAAKLR
jgi:hypothetical protein